MTELRIVQTSQRNRTAHLTENWANSISLESLTYIFRSLRLSISHFTTVSCNSMGAPQQPQIVFS
jgi:hypothetical protein